MSHKIDRFIEQKNIPSLDSKVSAFSWTPDLRYAAAGLEDGRFAIWSLQEGSRLVTSRSCSQPVICCSLSPDGRFAASGGEDGMLRVWEASSGKELRRVRAHRKGLSLCSWSPEGRYLITGGGDFFLKVWDLSTGVSCRELRGYFNPYRTGSWSPDGNCFTSGTLAGDLCVWDVEKGAGKAVFKLHNQIVTAIDWSPDGKYIASGDRYKELWIWEAGSGNNVLKKMGHEASLTSVAWSADGARVVSGDEDGVIKLWNAGNGLLIETCKLEKPVAAVRFLAGDEGILWADSSGSFGSLELSGRSCGLPLVTARREWIFESKKDYKLSGLFKGFGKLKFNGNRRDEYTCLCPCCQSGFGIDEKVIADIRGFLSNGKRLKAPGTACVCDNVEFEAANELQVNCRHCGRELRLNPFLGDSPTGAGL